MSARKAFVAVSGLPLMLASTAHAADITYRHVDDANVIAITGEILASDAATFDRLSSGLENVLVILRSKGGSLIPAIEIGKAIRAKSYDTFVGSNTTCASACALIWVAGSHRYMTARSRIGFHASYAIVDGRAEEIGVGNAMVGRYLTLLGLPEKAVLFATAASPTEISWIDPRSDATSGIATDITDEPESTSRFATPEAGRDSFAEDGTSVWRSGNWAVSRNDEHCILTATYTGESGVANRSSISIGFEGWSSQAILLVTNQKYASLVADRTYSIAIEFRKAELIDTGWGPKAAVGIGLADADKGFAFSLEPRALLSDFVMAHAVRFRMNGKVIDSYPLDGSAAGVAALRQCHADRLASTSR